MCDEYYYDSDDSEYDKESYDAGFDAAYKQIVGGLE